MVAFNEMRIAVGEALQPIGAQLQDAFSKFVSNTLPALVGASTTAAFGINKLLDVSAFLIGNFDKLAASALVLGSAVGAAGLAKAAITAGGAMNALRLALFDVKLAVSGLSKAIAFLAANPIVLLVAGVTAASVAPYRAATANDRFVKSIDDGKTTLDEAKEKVEEVTDTINTLQNRLDKTANKRLIQSLRRQLQSAYDDVNELNNAIERSIYRQFGGGKGFVGPVLPGMSYEDELPKPKRTVFDSLDSEDKGKGPKAMMSEIELALRRQLRGAIEAENQVLQANLQLALDMTAARQETEDANKRINMEEEAQAKFAATIKNINEKAQEDEVKRLRENRGLTHNYSSLSPPASLSLA